MQLLITIHQEGDGGLYTAAGDDVKKHPEVLKKSW